MQKIKKEKISFGERIAGNPLKSYFVFVVLSLIIFLQTLKFDFTYHDDLGLIQSEKLSLTNIKLIFEKGVFYFTGDIKPEMDIYYRPIQNCVYAFSNLIGGRKAPVHHFMSMLLHIIASCLLFSFLKQLGFKNIVAFLSTIIFVVHPLLVQGVAWIPGLGELLIAIFLLLSFIYLVKYFQHENKNLFQLIGALLFFLLALLSKESAIGFIPLALFYIFFINKNKNKLRGKLFFFSAGLIPVLILWFLLRHNAIGKYSIVSANSILDSLLHNGKLLIYYVGKIFLPFNLSPLQSPDDSYVTTGIVCCLLLIISFFVIKAKRNFKLLFFGFAWYLAFLLPTLFLTDLSFDFYAYNHRLYLPLIGFLVFISEVFAFNTGKYNLKIIYTSYLIPALIFLFASFNYCKAFENKYSFYETAIKNSPGSVLAYQSLGIFYSKEKECNKALDYFLKASALRPKAHALYGYVANTYLGCIGDIPNAIEWYKKAFAVDSISKFTANSAISLGNIYHISLKNDTLAKFWYAKAIEIDSAQSYPMGMLGNICLTLQPDSAMYWYEKTLKTDSTSSVAWNGMGLIKYKENKFNDAAFYFTKALSYNQEDIELEKNLMICYQLLNDFENTKKFAEAYKSKGGELPEYIVEYLNK